MAGREWHPECWRGREYPGGQEFFLARQDEKKESGCNQTSSEAAKEKARSLFIVRQSFRQIDFSAGDQPEGGFDNERKTDHRKRDP